MEALENLKKIRLEIHPELQLIPFQHIYQMLEEGKLDAVISFQEPVSAKAAAQSRTRRRFWVLVFSSIPGFLQRLLRLGVGGSHQ